MGDRRRRSGGRDRQRPEELASGSPSEGDAGRRGVDRRRATPTTVDRIRSLDAALTNERDEYLDALRRLQAEFDNYRKRTARQQSDLLARGTESLIERLLPVLDALDLALAHAAASRRATPRPTQALVQIAALLRDTLAKEGLGRIDGAGVEFDPTMHDAVAHAPIPSQRTSPATKDKHAADAVVDEVLRAGYLLKGRVLRPAMVRVRG